MIRRAILRTAGMFDDQDKTEPDFQLWQSIAAFMDGEKAYVLKNSWENKYAFFGLEDREKDKELLYMMEQDSMMGTFIDDRSGFDEVYDSGEYAPDGCVCLEERYLEFLD